jgi:hypothetical protein
MVSSMKRGISYLLQNHNCFPKAFQFIETTKSINTNIKVQNYSIKRNNTKFISIKGETTNRFEPIVILKAKIYLKINYKHQLGNVQIDETLTKLKAQELYIASWTLIEEQ